jgi:heat shock protein HslJ
MRTRLPIFSVAIVLTGLALSACGSSADNVQSAPPTTGPSGVSGRTYVSTGVAGHTLVDGTTVTLTFGDDGNLSAQAGCNTLGTTYTIDQDKLVADNIAGTEMGCDAPRHAQDEWLATFLSSRPTVAVEGDQLILVSGDTTLTLRDREVVQPDKPLEGTTWIADTLIDGDAASSVPDDPKVYLRFADGKVEGSDGCNGFGGAADIQGDAVTFGDIATEDKACTRNSPARDPLHELFQAGTVGIVADGERVTLTAPGGNGLGFQAE